MIVVINILLALVATATIATSSVDRATIRGYYIEEDEILDKTSEHKVIFAVKPLNVEVIEEILERVSFPTSPDYGKFKSSEDILKLMKNVDGIHRVESYLLSNGARILERTFHGAYITASAPIKTWEMILSTEFFTYRHTNERYPSVTRAKDYRIDQNIADYVAKIYNVNNFPMPSTIKPVITRMPLDAATGTITLSTLNTKYRIFTNTGNSLVNQSIFSSLGQYFGGTDITTFQSTYGIPIHLPNDPDNRNSQSQCNSDANNCGESNLDIEYMMAIAQSIPTEIM